MNSPIRQLMFVFVACAVALAASAGDPSGLAGAYKYVPEQSTDLPQAIEKAVERMNFIKRPIARSRLTKTNVAYQLIRIELSSSDAEISYDAHKPIRMPITGEPVRWTRDDGEVFDVSAMLDGGKLVQTYKAKDGTRVNSFHIDSSGALHLDVEVSSPQLPQPVRYTLVYRRAS